MTRIEAKEYIGKAKEQFWTVPNVLSCFRFLLIPVFVVLYVNGYGIEALITLVVSGLTDVLDGTIARKYNMITNLGRALDPIADKVTQAAMIICISLRFPHMWILLGVHVVKELVMLWWGYHVLDKTGTMNNANWWGKACTSLLYATVFLHIAWSQMPKIVSEAFMVVCSLMIIFCFVMYSISYTRLIRNHERKIKEQQLDTLTNTGENT